MRSIRHRALHKLQRTQRVIGKQLDRAHRRDSITEILHLEEQYRQIALRIELLTTA